MLFSNQNAFRKLCWENYESLWNSPPLEEPVTNLLNPVDEKAIRFYDRIRLNRGSKQFLVDFEELLTTDELFDLFLIVQLKQGHRSIRMEGDPANQFVVYDGA
jgi:hypothetical protein